MPVTALILLRLKSDQIDTICFDEVREEFIRALNPDKDDFYHEGSFQVIYNRDEGPIPVSYPKLKLSGFLFHRKRPDSLKGIRAYTFSAGFESRRSDGTKFLVL